MPWAEWYPRNNGNILKGTDANGHITDYHYDVLGQLLAQSDAAGFVTAFEHDWEMLSK